MKKEKKLTRKQKIKMNKGKPKGTSRYAKKKKFLDKAGGWGFEYPIGQKPWR